MKFIPYKKYGTNLQLSESSSSSNKSETNNSFDNMSLRSFSSVSSKTDSELKHVSTPSEASRSSSREELE